MVCGSNSQWKDVIGMIAAERRTKRHRDMSDRRALQSEAAMAEQAAKDIRGLAQLRDELGGSSNETRKLVAPEIRKYISLARTMGCGFICADNAVGSDASSLVVSQDAITEICVENTGTSARMAPLYTGAL